MKKETTALARAIENLIVAVLAQNIVVPEADSPKAEVFNTANMVAPAPVAPAPVAPAPVAPAPVAPAPVAPTPVAPTPAPAVTMTHDAVRAQLLPIIQASQEAMTAIHGVLTGQFAVNELTSLPVDQLPAFMAAVDVALPAK